MQKEGEIEIAAEEKGIVFKCLRLALLHKLHDEF